MGSKPNEPQLLEIPGAEGISVDYLANLMNQSAPTQNIPLEGTAGMGANEQTTQNLLSQYLASDPTKGEAYQLGIGELKKTLGGEFYDPKTSDFWKGYRETSLMEQEKGVADIRRRGQLGGGLYATPNMRTESDYLRGMGGQRTMMLGSLFEKERDRKTGAVGQALGYAGFGEEAKKNRLTAGSTIGALPRILEQHKLSSQHAQQLGQTQADFASEMSQIAFQSGAAQELMPQWHVDEGSGESPLGGILGLLGAVIGK